MKTHATLFRIFAYLFAFILAIGSLHTDRAAGRDKPDTGGRIAAALGVKDRPDSPFCIAKGSRPAASDEAFKRLPIGVFDSGTGGLTVFEAVLAGDEFDNRTGQPLAGGDGLPDLVGEAFVYYGDMANMPYGNYPSERRADFLAELCVKDALFLLGDRHHQSPKSTQVARKKPAKLIVIACNTATAYGKQPIEQLIEHLGLPVDVIGVVDAGVKGALEKMDADSPGTIGVMATVGTVMSGAYPRTIRLLAKERKQAGRIDVVQQGGFGIAAAVDGDPDYIDPTHATGGLRKDYKGPSFNHEQFPINRTMLPLYNFSHDDNGLLIERGESGIRQMQLNSAANYMKYHVTELVVKMQRQNAARPLRAIILGCTHYPYLDGVIRRQLDFLAQHTDDQGNKPFADLLRAGVVLIDPAKLTAREAYLALRRRQLLNGTGPSRAEFYLGVPNKDLPGVRLGPRGGFAYDYKYGRLPFQSATAAGSLPPVYVLRVPMYWSLLNAAAIDQIKNRLPLTYRRMQEYNRQPPAPSVVPQALRDRHY